MDGRLQDEPEDLVEAIAKRRLRWPPMSRRRKIAVAFAGISLVALIGTWTQRHGIADNFIRAELEKRGVEARYDVEDIGFSTQRLENLVIGDPARPDLVADWVEVRTRVTFGGPEVTGIRVGRARLRGLIEDGQLRLGAIDRLLPEPSGEPFALPELFVDVADARMRLETPAGLVGVKIAGQGRLDNGFTGRAAAVSERMAAGGCEATMVAAAIAVAVVERAPRVSGPLSAGTVTCGEVRVAAPRIELEAAFGALLDRWQGKASFAATRAAGGGLDARRPSGRIGFAGTAARTAGTIEANAPAAAMAGVGAGGFSLDGRYEAGDAGLTYRGAVRVADARIAPALADPVRGLARGAAGSPVGPLAARIADATAAAGQRFSGRAELSASMQGERGALSVARMDLASASGARVTLSGGDGMTIAWPDGGMTLAGTATMTGGGLPEGVVRLSRDTPGGPLTGTAILAPYAAGDARLALTPVDFTTGGGGATRFTTRASLSGPLLDGRIDGLVVPIDGRIAPGGAVTVNPGCAPARFDALAVSALRLGATRLNLCPEGPALVAWQAGRLTGGARIADPRLSGTLGGTPLTLAASEARYFLAGNRFTIAQVAARLGQGDSVSRLDIATLDGTIAGGGVAGGYAGAGGQIGRVPLLLSDAAGDWRLADGRLTLGGTLMVADAAPEPRFEPLAGDEVVLTLAGNDIRASGVLRHPEKRVKVADVEIEHDLGGGAGNARLGVPGIAFDENFQPDELTRLTFGVIADVVGSISGEGRIAWNGEGVSSTGTFRTQDMNLAAAFGPVEGLTSEIRFTDLLGLVSEGGQVATLGVVNPGIPIADGTVRYRLTGNQTVAVEGGRWPFAGGALVLEPTVLDFSTSAARRMTFRVEGVDAGQFVQQFEFENLTATGTFDGVLPMVFDEEGGRIEGGRLTARGGGNVAYVGEVSEENLGVWGNMAFDALKSLDYRSLDIRIDGPLSGEMVTDIRMAGVSQGEGTRSNFIVRRLANLPLQFNVTIRAPFRQLIDSVRSYYDPSRLIERNLPALIRRQEELDAAARGETVETGDDLSVQPPASKDVP